MRETTLKGTLLVVAAALTVGACDSSRDLSRKIVGPGGADAAIQVQLGSAAGLPGGTYFVASPADLWNRGTGLTGFFNSQNAFNYPAWVLEGKLRNATDDPRLPALASTTARWGRFAVIGGSAGFHGVENSYNFYAEITGLKPETDYTLMFVRYGLEVRGELDALNILTDRPADTPDSLFVLGGTPGGTPDYFCDFIVEDAPTATANANPFVIGYFTTNETGTATIDCVIFDGGIWYTTDNSPPENQAVLPFGGNRFAAFDLPAYNYIVIVEGRGTASNPVPNGPAVARVQMGVDLDASGNPIPNAMAPFPTEALPPATLAELQFRNATPLAPGQVYQFWAVNSSTGAASRITGDLRRYEPSGAVVQDSALGVSEYAGGGGVNDLNVFTATTATTELAFGEFDQIVIAIGPSGGSQPGSLRFLDGRYTALPANASLRFAGGYSYGGAGNAYFFGDELRILLTNLPAPPRGYFYEAWLTGSSPRSLGPILTPYPEYRSLENADETMQLGQLIANAALVVNRAELGVSWADFDGVAITLSPKSIAAPGVVPFHRALQAEIPAEVTGR